jgi:hypothetical protein
MAAEEKPKSSSNGKRTSLKTMASQIEAAKPSREVKPSNSITITPPAKIVESKPINAATPKSVGPKTSTKKPATVPRKKGAEVTIEQIQLRAYFIAERRRNLGIAGDETFDWVQAERELNTELGK